MDTLKRTLLSSLILILVLSVAFGQQEVTLTGTVTDSQSGEMLPGVNIAIKGTTKGSITDVDGKYTLSAPADATISFSFLGYLTQEVVVGSQTVVDIKLVPDVAQIEEVILIGYGTQKKSDKTGAVAHIGSEDFKGGVLTDAVEAMQGKVAGVLITKKGGDPNSGFSVKIRGAAGFDSNTDPLYVVDDVAGVDPTAIAPEDIESYTILKDAASTAIYGSRGANGVVFITTKKGKAGKGQVNFNTKISFDQVAKRFDILSADELRGFVNDVNSNAMTSKDSIKFNDGGGNTDWQDQVFRTGITQTHNLSFSGGNENSAYYAGITHANWEGVMKGTQKERTTLKLNLNHTTLNNKLNLAANITQMFENNDYENYDGFDKDDIIYQMITRNPTDPVYDSIGNYYEAGREFNYQNPLSIIDGVTNDRQAKKFIGNLKTDITILKGLVGSVNIGYIREDSKSNYYAPNGVFADNSVGNARNGYDNEYAKILETTLNYNKEIGANHTITAIGGYTWQENIFEGFAAKGRNPASPYAAGSNLGVLMDVQRDDISSYKRMSRLIGYFGRLQYNYNSKYYLSASLRRDGSTKFGKNNKWSTFPTISLGWNLHNEGFLSSVMWLSQLKLRGSYGESGNQEIGEYRSVIIYTPKLLLKDPETGKDVLTFAPEHNQNPDLKWETTKEYNVGLDFGVYRNRINGTIEGYYKLTEDLLGEYTDLAVPPYPTNRIWRNAGTLENKGIEIIITANVIQKQNITWKSTLTGSYNKTKYLDLGETYDAGTNAELRKVGYLSGRGLVGDENYVSAVLEGEERGAFYLPVYVRTSDDGAFLYESVTGGIDRDVTKAKRQVVGSPLPDYELGWTNNFGFFKYWSLDFSFRALIGNDVYNATRMFTDYNGNIPNLNGSKEAIDWHYKNRETPPVVADIYVEDGSFVRLDNLIISYSPPLKSNKLIKTLKFFISGNNLFILTNYSGVDPESSYNGAAFGIDQYNTYPKTKSYSLGLNASF